MTLPEQLAANEDFRAHCGEHPLSWLKKAYDAYSPGTVQRARTLVLNESAKLFAVDKGEPDPVNEDILADVGKPLPIDDYTPEEWEAFTGKGDAKQDPLADEEEQEAAMDAALDMLEAESGVALSAPVKWEQSEQGLLFDKTELPDMGREEAEHAVKAIRGNEMRLQMQLMEFHERKGWKALGYETWEECLSKEFGIQSRQHFEYLETCGRVYMNLLESGQFEVEELRKVHNSHLHAMRKLEAPEKQAEALTLSLARAETKEYRGKAQLHRGRLTESIVSQVVEEMLRPTNTEDAEKRLNRARKPTEAANPAGVQTSLDALLDDGEAPQGAEAVATCSTVGVNFTQAEEKNTSLPEPPQRDATELTFLRVESDEVAHTLYLVDDWGENYTLLLSNAYWTRK